MFAYELQTILSIAISTTHDLKAYLVNASTLSEQFAEASDEDCHIVAYDAWRHVIVCFTNQTSQSDEK